MAEPNDQATTGHRPVSLYVLVISAVIFAIVVVGANLVPEDDVDERLTELDEQDLVTIEERQRLPSAFTPAEGAAGSWAVSAEVYVPVYSSVYAGQGTLRSDLAATLSIRNTSRSDAIVIRSVEYFDTDGELVSRFLDRPYSLGPMATADFFIDAADVRGGTGANFLVAWAAETAVSEPLVEAVMIGSIGAKGISFVSRGWKIEAAPTGGAGD